MEGLKNADEIVKVPGVHAIFAVSSDFGNFAGYKQGDPSYEREINIVHDAAIKAGVKLCDPRAWKDRPDFSRCRPATRRRPSPAGQRSSLASLRIRGVSRR
jgi:hypothetical protein